MTHYSHEFFNLFRVLNRKARRSLSGKVKQQSRMSSVSSSSQDVSYTSSTTSSKYRYDGGRRYHGDEKVAYLLPNDNEGMCIFIVYKQLT